MSRSDSDDSDNGRRSWRKEKNRGSPDRERKHQSPIRQKRERSPVREHKRREERRKSPERKHRSPPRKSRVESKKDKRRHDSSNERRSRRDKNKPERRKSSSESSSFESEKFVKVVKEENHRGKYEDFLKNEKKLQKEKDKEMKQRLKETETPEQKRARRIAKKEAKERRRRQESGWDEEYAGYTNHDNPFGDSNLLQTFKWGKKLEKEGLKDLKEDQLEKMNRRKREEQRQELEKVKERRLERERERTEREQVMELEQRKREGAQFEEWAKQEDSFHLQQAKLRSKIRIDEGRAKPIDLLARYISAEEEDFSVEMIEPYLYLNGLTLDDFEDLIEDISVYMRLESKKNQEYWNDIQIIVDEEVRKLRGQTSDENPTGRSAVSTEVSGEIVNIFKGKTPKQLEQLKKQIELKLRDKQPGLDVAYWETLLSRLRSYMAHARLRERHEENLRKKLEKLKQEQGVHSTASQPIASTSGSALASPVEKQDNQDDEDDDDDCHYEIDPLQQKIDEYESGRYSPELLKPDQLELGTLLTDPQEDEQNRLARMQLIGAGQAQPALSKEERAFEMESRKGMGDAEAQFSVEHIMDEQTYQWSDMCRPRKPRYFNRVHTGFEWNKYNQTHYDIDNPPPKIVQGYKFNIFYPDLIDKNITPQYKLTACKDNPDFSVLRFHSGPPYEDIAFKVVNREWEYSYKKGFRCQFHNDIFQLWFHFKRYRYRR